MRTDCVELFLLWVGQNGSGGLAQRKQMAGTYFASSLFCLMNLRLTVFIQS
jgi:hypothetical protein